MRAGFFGIARQSRDHQEKPCPRSGGILGVGAGYALFQGIWNSIEKRRRLKMLDEAQREAISAADPKFNLSHLLTAFPVAVPLLTALATGGVTYAALDKSFPVVGKPKHTGPKRIRVLRDGRLQPLDTPPAEEDPVTKEAAFREQDLEDAGYEFLASFVAAANPGSVTSGLIAKAASGGIDEMEELLKQAGMDALLESLKGATDRDIPDDLRMLGTMGLMKSARLAPTVQAIAAAEYLEKFGPFYDEIAGDGTHMQKLASLGALMGVIARDQALPELAKRASVMPAQAAPGSGVLAWIKQLLSGGGSPSGHFQREERDQALTSDVAGPSEDGSDGGASEVESTGDNDVIDSLLSP